MATGKLVSYDETRGFGFVAPDIGGDDVFVHVNDIEVDKRRISLGSMLEFEVEEGHRGPKASRVRFASLVEGEPTSAEAGKPAPALSDEEVCDVLTMKECLDEITETLLNSVPTLTAQQVVQIRQQVAQVARAHGWVEA